MFCMKCGAKLSDTEIKCPLCGFDLPKISPLQEKAIYPRTKRPRDRADFRGLLLFVTLLVFALGCILFTFDLMENGVFLASVPYVSFLLFFYITFLLPKWFVRPNPVIFFPVSASVFLLLLFLLDLVWGSGWFFPLALPVTVPLILALEAVITLNRYLSYGKLYIYGGLFIFLGALSLFGEFLCRLYFDLSTTLTYSVLSFILFFIVGMGLIVIAIIPSFRRYFEKRFFL